MPKVWLPTGLASPLFALVDFSPRYGYDGEQPVHVQVYTQGTLRWYGSGSCEVVVADLPIKVRMPVRCVRGRLHWGLAASIRRELNVALRKITTPAAGAAQSGPGVEDAGAWPNLWEHLTLEKYPDGTPRERSSVIIVADANGWRGCLSDKDNARTMWKTATTVEALLLALEEGAASDDPSAWRAAGGGFKNRRKRS